jgi:P27 family predicted phage terminase small subunit
MPRPRKPTALKLLEGNPGKRPLPENEPELPAGAGGPPAHLDAGAKREWRRVEPILTTAGVLTQGDRAVLTIYCAAWSRWVHAEGMVAKSAPVLKSEGGALITNPYLRVSREACEQVMKAAAVLGLDPANRSRVQATKIEQPALVLVRPKTKLDAKGRA